MLRSILKNSGRLLGFVPTLAVLGLLGAVAYIGHEHGWRLSAREEEKKTERPSVANDDDERPVLDAIGRQVYSSFDPTLPMTHDPSKCKFNGEDIVFKDADAVRRAGISVGNVSEQRFESRLSVTGSVDFDPKRVARVSSRAGGILWKIDKQVGDEVHRDEILAIVDSGDVGRAKSALFLAKVQLDLKRYLRDRLQPGITPESSILVAEAGLREARAQLQTTYQALLNLSLKIPLNEVEKDSDEKLLQRLQFLGFDENMKAALPNETTNNLIAVTNPLLETGAVLQRDGVRGESVAAGQPIFVVGNTDRMLLILDIRQEDVYLVKANMPVRFHPDGDRGAPFEGKIDWVGQEVEPKTRTVKARVFVENKDDRLKARAFGMADIILHKEAIVLAVPEEAIQWEGCSHIVFLREKPERFEVRKVTLGNRHNGYVEVKKGVDAGDPIAVVGSHVLKSHLFKDRLGTPEE